MTTTKIDPINRSDNLADPALQSDIAAFLELRRELLTRAPELAAAIARDTVNSIATMPLHALEDLLWEARGRRSCLVLRTRFSQRAEREDGRRSRGRGRDVV